MSPLQQADGGAMKTAGHYGEWCAPGFFNSGTITGTTSAAHLWRFTRHSAAMVVVISVHRSIAGNVDKPGSCKDQGGGSEYTSGYTAV